MLTQKFPVGEVTSPSMYHLPHSEMVPEVEITAMTMRDDRPIYRNHQTTPDTDHQTLPRLCHEAVLYNRLTEIGLAVKDVRFPTWGAALSCILQFDYPREGFVNDALDDRDGRAVAQHQDGGRRQPRHQYRRCARRLSRHRDARGSGARHHHRAATPAARRSIRPGDRSRGTRRCASSARSASMPRASRATIRPISSGPGRSTGARWIWRTSSEQERSHEQAVTPPKPQVLVEAQPFIPYMREEDFAPKLKPVLEPYKKRMGFLPNALKLYAYRPEIAETLWRLNSKIMRDPIVDARSVAQAQARRGRLRHQRLRLLHGAQLLDAEKAAQATISRAGA